MYSVHSLPKFRDNLSVRNSRLKKSISWPLNMGQRGRTETSVRNYPYAMRNIPEESGSHALRSRSLKSGKGVTCLVISVNRFTEH
jgi:hypothetical protein